MVGSAAEPMAMVAEFTDVTFCTSTNGTNSLAQHGSANARRIVLTFVMIFFIDTSLSLHLLPLFIVETHNTLHGYTVGGQDLSLRSIHSDMYAFLFHPTLIIKFPCLSFAVEDDDITIYSLAVFSYVIGTDE